MTSNTTLFDLEADLALDFALGDGAERNEDLAEPALSPCAVACRGHAQSASVIFPVRSSSRRGGAGCCGFRRR